MDLTVPILCLAVVLLFGCKTVPKIDKTVKTGSQQVKERIEATVSDTKEYLGKTVEDTKETAQGFSQEVSKDIKDKIEKLK